MLEELLAAPLPPAPDRPPARPAVPAVDIPAVVLAAGAGSRLRPVTTSLVKPLVPLLNVPLLYWTVSALRAAGASRVVANASHLADQMLLAAQRIQERDGIPFDVVRERRLTGPAGGLAACRPLLPAADCHLVVSGDARTDVDLADVVDRHRRQDADLTIVATRVPDPWRFGALTLAGDRVVAMREKDPGAPPDSVVSCGMYVVSGSVLAGLTVPTTGAYDFTDVVAELLVAGRRVAAYVTDEYWADIGTLDALVDANLRALDMYGGESVVGAGAVIGAGVLLERSVIGAGARVGAGTRVRDSVVLPGVRVPGDAVLRRTVAT